MLADELHECVDIWEARVIYKLDDFKRTEELIKRANSSYLVRAFEAAININSNPTKALQITETFDLRNPRQRLTYHLFRAHIFGDAPASQFVEVKKAVEVGSKHGYFNHFLTQRSDVIQQYISIAAESPTSYNERLARAAGERLNEMMVGNASAGEFTNSSRSRYLAPPFNRLASKRYCEKSWYFKKYDKDSFAKLISQAWS